MGWRSWNAFGANVNNGTFVAAIDALTAKIFDGNKMSLLDAGYESIGIDEGWENCSGSDPNHGLRFAIIENEFGEVGVDERILSEKANKGNNMNTIDSNTKNKKKKKDMGSRRRRRSAEE